MDNYCFICFEGENCVQSPCDCTSLYVHESCLLNLVHKMNTTKCSICTQKYRNLLVTHKTKSKMNDRYKILICVITGQFCLGVMLVCLFTQNHHYSIGDTFYIAALSTVSFCFILTLYLLRFVIKIFWRESPELWTNETEILEARFLQASDGLDI